MAANSNYYGYSTGVQQSQVYGSQMQSPQVAQSAYAAQSSAGYGAQATTPASVPYASQTTQQTRAIPQSTQYAPSAASSYPQTALSGSSYGYTARVQDSTTHPTQSYQTSAHTGYSTQTPSSYYERTDATGSASYDASKSSSYYGQQHSTPTQQGYGYGSSTPATNKSMYSSQSHYSAQSAPTAQLQSAGATGSKNQTSSSVSGNVSYPYSTGKHQNSNYNQNTSSYSSSSNWSGSGGGVNNYQQTQGYDAAVYNAASSYFQQQQHPRPKWNRNNNNSNKPAQPRQKVPPKQQQLHYCDVCKISCAGPQTYKEHLEGQKHKKKEAAAKQMEAGDGYKCSLCDVICTGTEAFNAHLKGAKHLKTVKLHTKLGKPIPDIPSAEVQDKEKKKDEPPKEQTPKAFKNQPRRNRKPTAPKITFIGGQTLNTSNTSTESTPQTNTSTPTTPTTTTPSEGEKKETTESKETKFVGEDYVEEVKSDAGKVVGFECKLCDCKFNDQLAREAHLSGRRHKLSYKKKVQPDYVVDTKPAKGRPQQHKPLMDDKARRKWEQEIYWKKQEAAWRQEEVRRWGEEEYWRRLEEEERMWEEQEHQRHDVEMMNWDGRHRMGPPRPDFMPPDMFSPAVPRPKQDSQDDRLVMSKHKQIYPNEQELTAVQNIVSAVEKALKLVSDNIADEDTPAKPEVKEEKMEVAEGAAEEKAEVKNTEETEEAKKAAKPKDKPELPPRTLKGVMRVGVLAKGLLLHERLDVELVVLCQDRPTKQLLERVSTKLPEQLVKVTDEKYDVSVDSMTSTMVVSTTKEPAIKIVITLTSPVMRDDADAAVTEEQKDVLDKEKCLEALASLRHAKWFQAKANGVPSCVIIIRVLRDMRDRLPAFAPLSSWAMELLVEKCLSSAEHPLGPGEAFRRILECIASGILLPGGPGLHDPCEKEQTDASRDMTDQEREDLTAAAQHSLRLQAFRQLHKVLGVEPLPPSRFRGRHSRGGGRFKRRREDSGPGGDGSAKKEKKDGEESKASDPVAESPSAAAAAKPVTESPAKS